MTTGGINNQKLIDTTIHFDYNGTSIAIHGEHIFVDTHEDGGNEVFMDIKEVIDYILENGSANL